MESWQTLIVAGIAALSALGGTWLGLRGQRDEAATQRAAERRRHEYEEHRDAIVSMVTSAEKVEMLTRGAIDGERLLRSDEDIADWGACLPIVELLVGETTWNRLLPWVTLINMRYNAVWEGTPENLRRTLLESMKETGTLAQETYESARAEFLSIAREHLASLR